MDKTSKAAHILVVDDEVEFCDYLKDLLTAEGHRVSTAHDGTEALTVFNKKPADLIIMDIFMPKKEGLEAIGELKRDHPSTRIIAITASRDQPVLKLAQYLGAGKCLFKPFENRELLDAVRDMLTQNPSA